MNSKQFLIALVFVILLIQPATVMGQKPVTAGDLAWMAGRWRAEVWGGVGEEVWVKNSDNSLMCMFSFVKDSKPTFYEFLTLEPREQGLTLHLRHFHAKLIAWEDKDAPLLFTISKATANEVIFERVDSAGARTKISYKLEAPDRLTSTLERVKDGKSSVETFNFRRVVN
jgi:hypothetical protein